MDSQNVERIESFVNRSDIPQLNIGIWHNGSLFDASFGKAKLAEVDVFEIGSISKTFTASLLAILAEKDLVNFSDGVDKYLPNLPFAKEITLFHLVTHTSGLPNNPLKGLILNAEKALRDFNHADYQEYLEGITKLGKVGKCAYSNLGMAVLGNILADHLGMTYEDAVKEHLLLPLGMNDTHIPPQAFDSSRLADGHSGNGKVTPQFQWSSMEPAGLWRSTTKDMLVFLKAHLGYSGEHWKSLLGKTTAPAFDDPKRKHQALAWQLTSNEKLGDSAWHNGGTLGQKSMALCEKTSDSAIVILSNKAPRLWQHFFSRYSIEQLAFQLLESLRKNH